MKWQLVYVDKIDTSEFPCRMREKKNKECILSVIKMQAIY